jgi:hypothetical protein
VAMISTGEIVAQNYSHKNSAIAACKSFENGTFFPKGGPKEVWVIGDHFVCEAYLGGMQLGEVKNLDMTAYKVVDRLSQATLDKMMKAFFRKNGYFPDT